jgi:argininosuccinate synthase
MATKVVLAYSGGLDTSCILKVLLDEGYEVIAYIADVGQREDFEQHRQRAEQIGASKVHVVDLKREFVTDYIFPAIAANAIYENRYLLGTALARPVIAEHQVKMALAEGATALSHGATGKGNDQVRFELAFAAIAPRLEVIAPWKQRAFLDRFEGRSDLLSYAAEHQIPVEATAAKPYSTDENLMHKSYEAGVLEDPLQIPDRQMFTLTRSPVDAPDQPGEIELHFQDARPVKVVNRDETARPTRIPSSCSATSTSWVACTAWGASTSSRTVSSASSRGASTRRPAGRSSITPCATSRASRWTARCSACATASRRSSPS